MTNTLNHGLMMPSKEGRSYCGVPTIVALRPRPTTDPGRSLFAAVDVVTSSNAAELDLPDFLLLPHLQESNNSPRPLLMKAQRLPPHVLSTLKRKRGAPICEAALEKDTLSVILDKTVTSYDPDPEIFTPGCYRTPKKRISSTVIETSPPKIPKVTPDVVYEFQKTTVAQLPLLPTSF